MLDLQLIKDNLEIFRENLLAITSYKTVVINTDTAITVLAKEIYGSTDYYYILNMYNNRDPFYKVKKGDRIKAPYKELVLDAYMNLQRVLKSEENFTDGL